MPDSKPRGGQHRQILGLDVIRFGAALLVMFHHLGWRVWAENYALPMHYHYFQKWARPGFVGVEIFFVLSGLVIAYSASNATARSFVESRFIRLVPAAWICSTLTIAIVYVLGRSSMLLGGVPFSRDLGIRWLHSLVLYPLGPWVDGSYWTLGIECGFYLQVFLLLLWGKLRYLGPWITTLGLFGSICLWMVRPVGLHGSPIAGFAWFLDGVGGRLSFFFFLLHHGCFFAIGVLLWQCFYDRVTWQRVIAMVALGGGVFMDIRLRVEWSVHWVEPLILWLVALAAIVLSVKYNERIHARAGTRGAAIARRLGLVTYPLYLLHQVIGYALLSTLKPYLPDLFNFLLVFGGLIAFAFCVNLLLEEPLQRWVRATVLRRERLPVAPATTAP